MGSNASSWLFFSSSVSISASGVPARAESTSSAGSYSVTPLSAERSSVRSVWLGRPTARLVPCPASSSAFSLPSAQRTASSTSFASRGFNTSVMAGLGGFGQSGKHASACSLSFRRTRGGVLRKGRHDLTRESAQLVNSAGNGEQHIGDACLAQCLDHAHNFVGGAVKRILFSGARFVGIGQHVRPGFRRWIARNIDCAPRVFGLTHQRRLLVGPVLGHVELARDRYLHGIKHEAICFAFGLVDGNALAERCGRSVLIEDEIEPARGSTFDRMWISGSDPERRVRFLRRRRLNHDVREVPEAAFVREAFARGPGARHYFERLLETGLGFFGCDLESLELAVAVALADAKIEAAPGKQGQARRLFRPHPTSVPRRHDDRRAKPQCRRAHCQCSEQHQRGGYLIPSAEMMLNGKTGVKAERLGFDIEIEEFEEPPPGLGSEAWNVGFG